MGIEVCGISFGPVLLDCNIVLVIFGYKVCPMEGFLCFVFFMWVSITFALPFVLKGCS